MTAVERDAEEFYEFKGDPTYGEPPYWVARTGRRVTSQVGDSPAESVDCASVEEARVEFADATCEPNGPGAPMPDDVIQIVWGPAEGETFTVESVVARDGQFGVTGYRVGRPLVLTLGQYRIVSPAGVMDNFNAFVTVADNGALAPWSRAFVLHDGPGPDNAPVPEQAKNGYIVAAHRIAEALATIGFKLKRNTPFVLDYDVDLEEHPVHVQRFNAVPKES